MMDQSTATLERLAFEASQWAKANNIGADQPSLVFARRFAFLIEQQGLALSALAAPPSPSKADVGALVEAATEVLQFAMVRSQAGETPFGAAWDGLKSALASFRASHDGGL